MGFVSADKNKQMVNVSMIQTSSYSEIKLKVEEKRRIGNIDYRQTRYNDTGRFNEIVFLQVDTIKKTLYNTNHDMACITLKKR